MNERRERPNLLIIPIEIRLLIYGHVYAPGPSEFLPDTNFNFDPGKESRVKISEWRSSIQHKLTLLLVCNQIYHESKDIALQQTVFHITKVSVGMYGYEGRLFDLEGYNAAWAS